MSEKSQCFFGTSHMVMERENSVSKLRFHILFILNHSKVDPIKIVAQKKFFPENFATNPLGHLIFVIMGCMQNFSLLGYSTRER